MDRNVDLVDEIAGNAPLGEVYGKMSPREIVEADYRYKLKNNRAALSAKLPPDGDEFPEEDMIH